MAQVTVDTEQQLISGIRQAFAESRDAMTQAHLISGCLRDAFDAGWPESSDKLGSEHGTYEIYRDEDYGHPNPGFVVLAYRQPPQREMRPSPHDHGICFVVYGVKSGSNLQTRYSFKYSEDRGQKPKLETTQVVLQEHGDVDYFLPGEIHSTQGSTERETIYVRVTSMDLNTIQRHRYNNETGESVVFTSQAVGQ